jgi:hypothetical protein
VTRINVWAVLLAAASSFLLGGLWYSKALFGGIWNRAAGRGEKASEPEPGQGHGGRVFAVSFAFSLVAAAAFGWWLGPSPDLFVALRQGLLAGACFVAASFGINYQFAGRSMAMWLVDGGYHTAQFVLFGLVLGLWH